MRSATRRNTNVLHWLPPERLEPRRLLADAAGVFVSFGAARYDVPEDAGAAVVTVRRSGDTTGATDVTYKLFGGPAYLIGATPGADFEDVSGTITFAPGETAKTFSVPIVDDTLAEGNEWIRITFTAASGGARGAEPAHTQIHILDNDSPGVLALSQREYRVDEGAGTATITVTRGGTLRGEVGVSYQAATPPHSAVFPPPPNIAFHGEDFEPVSGTITFADGQTTATFTVPIVQDAAPEPEQFFGVYLSRPTGGATLASLRESEARVVIVDDDAVPPPPDPEPQPPDDGEAEPPVPVVDGTAGADRILLLARPGGRVAVFVNGAHRGVFDAPGGIRVNGGGGNDAIHAGRVATPVILDGGAGHDLLVGGFAGDLLLGGDGHDRVSGGPSHDLLVGGAGSDRLGGDGGDDILVAGTTDFHPATAAGIDALRGLLAHWNGSGDYATRLAAVTTAAPGPAPAGIPLLTPQTANTDAAMDVLTGNVGRDLFFADTQRTRFRDFVVGRVPGETLVEL